MSVKKIIVFIIIPTICVVIFFLYLWTQNSYQAKENANRKLINVGYEKSYIKVRGTIISIDRAKNEIIVSIGQYRLYRTIAIPAKATPTLKVCDEVVMDVEYVGNKAKTVQIVKPKTKPAKPVKK